MSENARTSPLVLAFESEHCPPCRALAPVLAELEERYAGRVEVEVVDTGERLDLAQRYGVMSVPTLLGIAGGRVVTQQVGFAGAARVEALFRSLLEG